MDFSHSSPASILPLPSFFYFLFSLSLSLSRVADLPPAVRKKCRSLPRGQVWIPPTGPIKFFSNSNRVSIWCSSQLIALEDFSVAFSTSDFGESLPCWWERLCERKEKGEEEEGLVAVGLFCFGCDDLSGSDNEQLYISLPKNVVKSGTSSPPTPPLPCRMRHYTVPPPSCNGWGSGNERESRCCFAARSRMNGGFAEFVPI